MIGRLLVLVLLAAGVTACAGGRSAIEDASVVSSIRYDDTECGALVAQRNALAQRFSLPREAERPRFETRRAGLGVILPDLRGRDAREREQASFLIAAMNRSITRRNCEGPPRDRRP